MANDKNNVPENQNAIDNLNDTLTGMSRKVEDNKKPIAIAIVLLIIVVGAILFFKDNSAKNSAKADDAIGMADNSLMAGNDSLALEQYKQAIEKGHDAGNRASLNAAILLFQQKKYEEAVQYINKYSPKEAIIGAEALSLKGDCYVNLKDYAKAADAFKAAVKQSDKNPYFTPYFMLKLARVYNAQQDYKAEAKLYKEIKKDYPVYCASTGLNIDKYIERASINAGE